MHAISVGAPYLDTNADHLCLSLDLTERPALAERLVSVGGLDVRLRLVGASHQVLAGPGRENLACRRGAVKGLPTTYSRRLPGWIYNFSAETRRLAPEGFSARVARILGRAADDGNSLCGIYPGSPQAVTAVVVEAVDGPPGGGLVWRTWHTYPQYGQIVTTHTRLEVR